MNRKLINGLLVATLAIGSAMPVTSCKDTEEDLYAQLRDENATLDQRVKADIEALKQAQQALENAQKKCEQDCKNAWEQFKLTGFDECLNEYVKKHGDHTTLAWYLEQIDGALTTADGTEYNSIGERFLALESALTLLNNTNITEIPGMSEVAQWLKDHETTLPAILEAALDAEKQANTNNAILEALLKGYDYSDKDLTQITGLLKKAVDDAAAAKQNASDALTKAGDAVATANTASQVATAAKTAVEQLETRVKANEKSIKELTSKLDAMTGRLNHLVTGIVLQQVNNPIFGKLNLPLDVNSKMLVAYYGDATNVNFPPVGISGTEYDNQSIVITEADKNLIGITTDRFNGVLHADYGTTDNINLGSVYLSVNPAGLDVTGANWNLVNSKGETSVVKLSALEKSDEELMFGFGRAADVPNGFYVTNATVPASSIDDVKVTLDDNFKDNVETLLNRHSLTDIAELAKLIAKQFNNKVPASGIRADWEYDEYTFNDKGEIATTTKVKDATYSEFGLAATAYKPLSYRFLYGTHFKPLGTISPIEDFTLDSKLTINMPTFTFNFDDVDLGFSFGDITVSIPEGTEIEVVIPETKVYKVVDGVTTTEVIGVIKEQKVKAKDFTSLENALSTSISESLKAQDQAINDAFKKAIGKIASQINSQINTKMGELKTSIEGQFDNIMKEIQDQVNGYLGTVNNYIDKANNFLNRINRVLEDPNHYLQVTMLYTAGDGSFHQVSNASAMPTALVLNGGDAVKLTATSYTYDMIVPSFRKYIAVTNVYDTNTRVTDNTLLQETNAAPYLNEIIDGTQSEVALKLKAGYTYEIVYSSLDYHGITSTRKFYISAE